MTDGYKVPISNIESTMSKCDVTQIEINSKTGNATVVVKNSDLSKTVTIIDLSGIGMSKYITFLSCFHNNKKLDIHLADNVVSNVSLNMDQ
ncbi:hypothetical protein [Xenorhabdus siamensis]|uniref:hypothetical protein n=1 Tax=Xenorhabdus siamensis TaxID=3136254 RepID=UPI0030F3C867